MRGYRPLLAGVALLIVTVACGANPDEDIPTTPVDEATATGTVAESPCDITFSGNVAGGSGAYRIYCVAADGSGLRPLTHLPDIAFDIHTREFSPAWSPDGTQIAFSRSGLQGGVFVIDADGNNERRIADGWAMDIEWSPDSTWLVFSWLEEGGDMEGLERPTQLVMLHADGSDRHDVSDLTGRSNQEVRDFRPAWSPDGTQLLFQRFGRATNALYIVTLDSLELQQVETGNLNVFYGSPGITWMPDGESIAVHGSAPDADGVPSIFRVPLTGGSPERVSPIDLPTLAGLPAWSSDGSRLAYGSARDGTIMTPTNELLELDLFIVGINDGTVQQVTDTPGVQEVVAGWSPDDTRLLYLVIPPDDEMSGNDSVEGISLEVIDVDGSSAVVLVAAFSMEPPFESGPAWRPAGD